MNTQLSRVVPVLTLLASAICGQIALGADAPAATTPPAASVRYPSLPSFPGAEGFGMYATGGRAGSVYEVTNIKDYDPRSEDPIPGSLRDAVSQGDRIIVFRVSGTIVLKSAMSISASNITIEGQTAPGDGICLRGYPFGVTGHNFIIRYIRSRLGDETHQEEDSLDIFNNAYNGIYDHCSATWAVDENFSTSGVDSDFTIQWCLIAHGLTDSFHSKGPHGYGSLARANGDASWLYNLWADNLERSARLGDAYGRNGTGANFEFRSNVIYNYGRAANGLTQGHLMVNYLNNYFRPGPSSNVTAKPIHTPGPDDLSAMPSNLTYYMKGNVWEGNDTATKNNELFFDHTQGDGWLETHFSQTPVISPPPVSKILSAQDSLQAVLDNVGDTLPVRDRVDAAIVQQARDKTGSLIDTQTQDGGWPELKSSTPPAESFPDGIPDAWKTAHGLDTKDPKLATTIDQNGYTYLEEYLNGTDPRIKVDYLDPKNNVSSLKPGPSLPLWVPTADEAAAVKAVYDKYHKYGSTSTYPDAPP